MKGCIIGAAVLCAVILLVSLNAVYVNRVSDTLLADLDTLPALPDPTNTPHMIAAIAADFEKKTTLLSLSVNYTLPDRIAESLSALEAQARLGDGFQYAATLAILRDLCEDLARAERFRAENIF